jgi:hypothetical protein
MKKSEEFIHGFELVDHAFHCNNFLKLSRADNGIAIDGLTTHKINNSKS